MPAPAWIPPGVDLDFVMTKRPRDVRDLLKHGKPWTDLFNRWYAHAYPGMKQADLTLWLRLDRGYARTGSLHKTLADLPAARTRLEAWNLLIGLSFFEECGKVRAWLEEEKRRAREELEAERGPGSWLRAGVPESKVRARQRHNAALAIAGAQSREWEEAAAADPGMTEKTLCQMEAVLTAYTRVVKPRFIELYEMHAGGAANGPASAMAVLADAYTGLGSAEARLRAACTGLRRRPGPAGRTAQDELLAAWVEYTRAGTALGTALVDFSRETVRWAAADTSAKIRGNFASVHPRVAGAQLTVSLAVTVLSALIQSFGLMAVAVSPVITAAAVSAASLLTVALNVIERLTVAKIAEADARHRDVVTEHVGREYRVPPSGEKARRVATEAGYAATTAGPAVVPALQWANVSGGTSLGGASAFIPFAGPVLRLGTLAVTFDELANPRVLTDTRHREALLKLLERAYSELAATAPSVEVKVLHVDPADGAAQVMVNGSRGVLKEGRFHPDDRTGALRGVLRNWSRATGDVNPGLPVPAGEYPGVRRFTLLSGGAPATPSNVLDGILSHREEPGSGFRCTATASGFGPGSGADSWLVSFFLTYEGEARIHEAEFQWLTLHAQDREKLSVTACGMRDALSLLELKRDDPRLENLLAVQEALALPAGPLTVEGGMLLDSSGRQITALEELGRLCHDVHVFNETTRQLEDGTPVVLGDLGLPTPLMEALVTWAEPLARFEDLHRLPDDLARWDTIQRTLAELDHDPMTRARFFRFVVKDDALYAGYLRVTQLFSLAFQLRNEAPDGPLPADRSDLLDGLSDTEKEWLDSFRKQLPFRDAPLDGDL
ncbi:hypothetical protein ACFXPI_02395 [Streptomyces sp. NPDC059104]|uniref:hypothetical protein n=1 Tax=Streptomyces sp. NPDC059104 TaxID=3346729 RepID=UPI0036912712